MRNFAYYIAFAIALLAHQSHFFPWITYPAFDKMMAVALVLFVWAGNNKEDGKGERVLKALILGLFIAKACKHVLGNPYEWDIKDYWYAILGGLFSLAEYKGWLSKSFLLGILKSLKGWFKLIKVKLKERYNAVISWWHRTRYILWRKK